MQNKNESKSVSAVKCMILADRLHRNAVEARINELGIHRSQHMALMYISCCGKAVTQTDIAKALEISPAAVAVTLKKLEKSGLITRAPQKGDARANSIVLTDEAKALVKRSGDIFTSVDRAMCEDIPDEELDRLISCMTKMIDNLKKYTSGDNREEKNS